MVCGLHPPHTRVPPPPHGEIPALGESKLTLVSFRGSPLQREFQKKPRNPGSRVPRPLKPALYYEKQRSLPGLNQFTANVEPKPDTYFCRKVSSDLHQLQSASAIKTHWCVGSSSVLPPTPTGKEVAGRTTRMGLGRELQPHSFSALLGQGWLPSPPPPRGHQ